MANILVSKDGKTFHEVPSEVDETGSDKALEIAKGKGYQQYHDVEKNGKVFTIPATELRGAMGKGYVVKGTAVDNTPEPSRIVRAANRLGEIASSAKDSLVKGVEKSVNLNTGNGPTQQEQAEAFGAGALRGTMLPVEGIAAGLQEAGKLNRDYAGAAQRNKQSLDLAQAKAPTFGEIGEIGVGSGLPIPSGKAVKAVESATGINPTIRGVGDAFERSAARSATNLADPTAKQLNKINKVNPELGQRLLDEGLVGSMGLKKRKIAELRAKAGDTLDGFYAKADQEAGNAFMDKEEIKQSLLAAKQSVSPNNQTGRLIRKEIDDHIEEIENATAEGASPWVSARDMQKDKSAFQETSSSRFLSNAPTETRAKAEAAGIMGKEYRNLLNRRMEERVGEGYKKANKDFSDYEAVSSVLRSKKDKNYVDAGSVTAATLGSIAGGVPGAIVAPIARRVAPDLINANLAKGKHLIADALTDVSQGVPDVLAQRGSAAAIQQAASPEQDPKVQALLIAADEKYKDPKQAAIIKDLILKSVKNP